MKKYIALFAGFLFLTPIMQLKAVALDPLTGVYDSETTLEAKLTVKPPQGDFNAVSVRLKVINAEVIDFIPEIGTNWIGLSQDCKDNTSYFTANTLCLSLAKTTSLESGELIGTLKLRIDGKSTVRIIKEEGTKYSNGTDTVDDLGDAAIFYTSADLANTTGESQPVSEPMNQVTDNSLPVIALIVVLLVGILIGTYILLKRKNNLGLRTANSKTKLVAIVLGLGVLSISVGLIGLNLSSNLGIVNSLAGAGGGGGLCEGHGSGYRACYDGYSYYVCDSTGGFTRLPCPGGNTCNSGTGQCDVSVSSLPVCGSGLECSASPKSGATECKQSSASTTRVYCCPSDKKLQGESCVPKTSGSGTGTGTGSGTTTGSGTGSTSSGSGSTSGSGSSGTGTTGSGSTSGSSSTTTATARKAVCGESCNTDADCAVTGFGVKAICNANKKCASPACPTDTQDGSQCGCKTATSKCGDKCGIWDEGFQPLCGDGRSTCSWINGPTCGGTNKTYCMPITPAAGYTTAACTNTAAASGYKYLIDPSGKPITTQSQILAACAQTTAKKCYRCTVATTDGNACESADADSAGNCPSGYSENSNCAATYTNAACPSTDSQSIPDCGPMDSDGDQKLTVIDFANFAKMFNKACKVATSPTGFPCGSKDTNSDGMIDITDFAVYAKKAAKPNCTEI